MLGKARARHIPKLAATSVAGDSGTGWLLRAIVPLARPRIAGLVALVVYLLLTSIDVHGLRATNLAYFNYLADAFLHGQLHLRLQPKADYDLILYNSRLYLYWPPFPAVLLMPLVALFGVTLSDMIYTAVLAAVSVGLLSKLLAVLHDTGIAHLDTERRAILVTSCGFGSVLLVMAPHGNVWFTSQIVGWVFVLFAALSAITRPGRFGYFLTGLALSCATATRMGLLFVGLWLAYLMLRRDWHLDGSERIARVLCGLLPLMCTMVAVGLYNASRFGNPLEMGVAWHNYSPELYGADFARYGVFNLHYLPINLYYHFLAFPYVKYKEGIGSGLFWMTPILLGAPYAIWQHRHRPLIWALVGSCLLIYVPIGLVMGTGYFFGSRYMLDLMLPLVVLTALGIRRWRLDALQVLMLIGMTTFVIGSILVYLNSTAPIN